MRETGERANTLSAGIGFRCQNAAALTCTIGAGERKFRGQTPCHTEPLIDAAECLVDLA